MNGGLPNLHESFRSTVFSFKRVLPLSFVLAFLCAIFNVPLSARHKTDISLTATGQKASQDAKAAVVWLRRPGIADLRKQNFSVRKSSGWEIKDNLIFISTRNQPAVLELRADSRIRKVELIKTPYSGALDLEINGKNKRMDLFDKNQSSEVIELQHFGGNHRSFTPAVLEFARVFASYFLSFLVITIAMLPIYAMLPTPSSSVALDSNEIILKRKYLILMSLAVFFLLVRAYYPGTMMLDSYLMYMQAVSHEFHDWHSPMMAVIWSFTNKIIPGSGGLFLLHICIMVSSVYLLSRVALLHGKKFYFLPMAMIFLPTISILLFVLMTDISMALFFLLACSLWYFWRTTGKLTKPKLLLIFALVFYGSALRHTAIAGAIPLFVLFLLEFLRPKKAIALSIVLGAFCILINQVFVYKILHTFRRHVSQAIMAHDLMGIYAITKVNYFPEIYLRKEKLDVLMQSFDHKTLDPTTLIEYEGSFITRDVRILQQLRKRWIKAILQRPEAYLKHRWILFESFLNDADAWTPTTIVSEPRPPILRSMPAPLLEQTSLGEVHSGYVLWLYRNVPFLFTAFLYVLLSILLLMVSLRRRKKIPAALAASSLLYIIPYFFFAPGGCYRYTYWSVFATCLAMLVLWMETGTKAKLVAEGT